MGKGGGGRGGCIVKVGGIHVYCVGQHGGEVGEEGVDKGPYVGLRQPGGEGVVEIVGVRRGGAGAWVEAYFHL